MSRNKFIEAFGWYGVVAILAAYILLNFSILSVSSVWYQLLNATGAIAIVIDALSQKNWQPAVLNIIWLLVALFALAKIFL